MRFVLDEDTPAKSIRAFLVDRGHECWTATEAGLSGSADDSIAAYAADKGAVLLSHDAGLAERRKARTFGPHVWLHCHQRAALHVLSTHIERVEALIGDQMKACVIELQPHRLTFHPPQWRG